MNATTAIVIPTLKTERLVMRAPETDDFEVFAQFYASPRANFVGGPLDREGAWRMLAMEIGHWRLADFGRWIAARRDTGAPVGLIGAFCPEGWPEPELGWDLFEGHEGHGYATEAARAARAHVYDHLGWTTAISLVKPGNDASARVCERLGARPDGSFTHARHGFMHVWRHPGPAELAQ